VDIGYCIRQNNMFTFFTLLSGIFTAWRTLWYLKWKLHWKCLAALAVLQIATRFKILRVLKVDAYIPGTLRMIFSALFACFFIFFLFLLIEFVISGVLYFYFKAKGKYDADKMMRRHNTAVLVLLAFTVIITAAGIISGRSGAELKKEDFSIPALPRSAHGMKLVLLSDLHIDEFTTAGELRKIVDKVNSVRPDAVLITGDWSDGTVEEFGHLVSILKNIDAKHGIFGVPGNHDYFYDFDRWMKFYSENNIKILLNQSVTLPEKITIAGVTDPVAGRLGKEMPDFKKTWQDIPPDAVVILLAHQPKLAAEAKNYQVALQLSGHTHGGMMPFFKTLVKLFNNNWVSGRYDLGNMFLYVSNGTGIWNGFPLRINCPAEITVITLIGK